MVFIKPILYRGAAFILLLAVFFVSDAKAQKIFTVTGVTFQKASQSRVSQVTIGNVNRRTIAKSDNLGVFRIEAAAGDTLVFNKNLYTSQNIIVLNDDLLSVYMQPIVTLEEVKISDLSTRQELNNTMENYMKKTPYGTLRPGVVASVLSPISGLSNLFGKTANNARRFEAFSKREMEDVEIEKRYNKSVIKKVITDISDDDLTVFMMSFKPSYDQVKVWAEYDIIKYIQNSYDHFINNRESYKSQKLY